MEHTAFLLRIDPADEKEYFERHLHVYPELEEAFGQAGIREYHIYYDEGTLFAYMMAEDWDAAMGQLADHPANARWQAYMADLLLPWENGEKVRVIREAYRYPRGSG
ncbi:MULTISPECIES: L-rhamnose mutarotase [Paenibacillus]|uniref:L-rhamnose mutarotase n=1 Tax=Paenibacillus TaxID=44249 RepID=UPI0022B886DA|nr:L-rhamnose mutarotase [Paenibacillus caseinilyticus]MCZ8519789.1 L-rhamnose mutarotase [Paenibacillus caseinilyticus]